MEACAVLISSAVPARHLRRWRLSLLEAELGVRNPLWPPKKAIHNDARSEFSFPNSRASRSARRAAICGSGGKRIHRINWGCRQREDNVAQRYPAHDSE